MGVLFSCFTLTLEEDTVHRHSLQPVCEPFRVKGVRLSVPHDLGEPEALTCEVASGCKSHTKWAPFYGNGTFFGFVDQMILLVHIR